MDDVPGWTEGRRADGVAARRTATGAWVVVPTNEGPVLSHCLCCGALLMSFRAAAMTADYVYPEAKPA